MFGYGSDCKGFFGIATHGHPQLLLQFDGHKGNQLVIYKYWSSGHVGLDMFKTLGGGLGPMKTMWASH